MITSIAPTRLEIHVFRAAIDNPVRTSFGTMTARTALLLRIEDGEGAHGWGEVWCNFPQVGAENKARLVETMIAPGVLGRRWDSPQSAWLDLGARLRRQALQSGEPGPYAACLAGLDMAMWDLLARRAGLPLWKALGGSTPPEPLRAYASGINPEAAAETVARCRARGWRAFKLKVGFDAAGDLANVAAICRDLRPGECFMVDANQGWEPESARRAILALSDYPLQWIEEPICVDEPAAQWAELALLARAPLAGGENIIGLGAFEQAIAQGHLGVIQPDLGKWGGFSGCLPVGRRARAAGRRFCPHWLNSGLGLMASAHLLAAVGGDGMLEDDCNDNPLKAALAAPLPDLVEGLLRLSDAPGLGVEPDLAAARSMQVAHRELRA